ncbi:MAG: hypothetical protein AAGC69_00765 [Paracraurococcus sp.]
MPEARLPDPDGGDAGTAPHPIAAPGPEATVRSERRQERKGEALWQTIAIRRRDGTLWTAYQRRLALPRDPGLACRVEQRAACVLALTAAALEAVEAARQARSAMLDGDESPPAWSVHFADAP